jgi:hypothetical protein
MLVSTAPGVTALTVTPLSANDDDAAVTTTDLGSDQANSPT